MYQHGTRQEKGKAWCRFVIMPLKALSASFRFQCSCSNLTPVANLLHKFTFLRTLETVMQVTNPLQVMQAFASFLAHTKGTDLKCLNKSGYQVLL